MRLGEVRGIAIKRNLGMGPGQSGNETRSLGMRLREARIGRVDLGMKD